MNQHILEGKTIRATRIFEWHMVIMFTDGTELLMVIQERFTGAGKIGTLLVPYLDGVELSELRKNGSAH